MASEEQVKALSVWVSPFGMRMVIGLEEKGVKYDYQEEENWQNKSELLLKMNPIYKKIPVLIHNGKHVIESLIVLEYIDEAWPSSHNNFLPSNPYDRAIAKFWADFTDKKICETAVTIVKTTGETQEEAKREFIESLVLLEGVLREICGGKAYFGGERIGFVDIVFIPLVCWFHAVEVLGGFKIPLEEKCPSIDAWVKRCMERESVKKILPQPEKVLEFAIGFRNVRLTG
eukprot:Gb_16567 [translate_table: standard]